MAREKGSRWLRLATLLVIWLQPLQVRAADSPAVERFRAAAALQDRALYDLAIAEYEAIVSDHATAPLAQRAQLQRGICLFQLARFDEARAELSCVHREPDALSPAEQEQLLAFLSLAQFNASHAATAADRPELLAAAIQTLDEQLTRFPNGPLAEQSSFYRAEALYARGRIAPAVAAYRKLLTQYPQHPQRANALYALGVAEQELGEFAAASKTLQQFAREYPHHAATADARQRRGQVLLALAESQFQEGNTSDAREGIAHLLAEFPESAFVPRALLVRAGIEVQTSQTSAAEATLDSCLARSVDPQVSLEARLLRATVRQSRCDFAGGLADVQKVLAAEPHRSAALHVRGSCELGLNQPLAAAKTFRSILDLDPNYSSADRVLYDLAWACHAANDPGQANATYAKLIETHPHSPLVPECQYRLGESHYAKADFATAANCFQAALAAATDLILAERAAHKLAWCQFEQGDFAGAHATFLRQADQFNDGPLAADARIMAAECRFQQQAFADALSQFAAALELPNSSDSLRAMALVHAAHSASELGKWQLAVDFASQSLRDFPNSAWSNEAGCELGVALLETSQLDDAERELASLLAAAKPPLALRAEFTLGRVQLARHNSDEAVRTFFKVAYGHGGPKAPASFHHWQAEAIYAAAQALEDAARTDSAEKLYQELVEYYPSSSRVTTARQSLDRIMRR